MLKTITLLLDGAGDRSYKELNNKTPLAYALTPNLDKLARKAQCGLMLPYRIGCSLGTDLAHFLLFGYDMDEYPGRSVIDAIGEHHKFSPSTLLLRASFAHVVEDNGYLLKSRFSKDLSDDEAVALCQSLSMTFEGYDFKVCHSYDSHCLIFVEGDNLSDKISDTDPFYVEQYVMKSEAFETVCEKADFTANLLNRYLKHASEILKTHSINKNRQEKGLELANMLLSKWAGKNQDIETFYQRNGMKGLLLGQSTLLEGLSKVIGLPYESYNSFEEGIDQALSSNAEYVHLHTKLPDTASHLKDPFKKVRTFEDIDQKLEKLLDFEGLLIVTADHSTPCAGDMIHSGETVPFMAVGDYIRRDDVQSFDEIACSKGSVYLNAKDFMPYIHNATDRGTLYHLRAGKRWHNYRVREVNKL